MQLCTGFQSYNYAINHKFTVDKSVLTLSMLLLYNCDVYGLYIRARNNRRKYMELVLRAVTDKFMLYSKLQIDVTVH